MKILFTSTYYNNPAFIELQLLSLQKFCVQPFDFLVMDDSEDETKSLVTGGCATTEIKAECERLGVKYHKVPAWIHANKINGGLVPNGEPANHPTERHRACLHWILANTQLLGWGAYNYVALAESDMLLRKFVDFHQIMNQGVLQLCGTGRSNTQVNRKNPNQSDWPAEYAEHSNVTIDFLTMYLTIFNIDKPINFKALDITGFGGTDTGGCTSLLLRHMEYCRDYKFIEISGNTDYQVDFFYTNMLGFGQQATSGQSFEAEAQFVHYRGGSNWDYQTQEYYWEKFYRMLRQYVPDLYNAGTARHSTTTLTSRDKEHSFKPE